MYLVILSRDPKVMSLNYYLIYYSMTMIIVIERLDPNIYFIIITFFVYVCLPIFILTK